MNSFYIVNQNVEFHPPVSVLKTLRYKENRIETKTSFSLTTRPKYSTDEVAKVQNIL